MKRLIRSAAMVLLILAVTLAIAADKAKTLYNKGKDAEARENYEQAYDYYKQAYDLKPTELTYKSAFDRLRFLAGASHVHRGQLLREAGQLDTALAEFQKAFDIDPSSAIAQQEIQHTKQMIEAAKAAGTKSVNRSSEWRAEAPAGSRRSGRAGDHFEYSRSILRSPKTPRSFTRP